MYWNFRKGTDRMRSRLFAPEEKIFRVQKESQEWVEKLDIACVGDLNDRITGEGIQNILT